MLRKILLWNFSVILILSLETSCYSQQHQKPSSDFFVLDSKESKQFNYPQKIFSDTDEYAGLPAFFQRKYEGTDAVDDSVYQTLAKASNNNHFEQPSQITKRRKGPTLSVVNPLEILRQRLMLDMARRRIHENQQQIVANAQMLENLGKRSGGSDITHRIFSSNSEEQEEGESSRYSH